MCYQREANDKTMFIKKNTVPIYYYYLLFLRNVYVILN